MNGQAGRQTFMRELYQALNNLYDPRELRRSLLVEVFPLAAEEDAGLALRRLLVDAIEALKPDKDVPLQSVGWRIYHVLFERYTEQSTQRQVAKDLGLSIRQLRRLENEAREALADYLRRRYDFSPSAHAILEAGALVHEDSGETAAEKGLSREQELEWLQRSTSSEPANVRQVIYEVLHTTAPLLRASKVDVEPSIPADLPLIAAQVTALRQGLLSVLTEAIRAVPGGKVMIDAQAGLRRVHITIRARAGHLLAQVGACCEADELGMAQQLVRVSGGELRILSSGEAEAPFGVRLSFQMVRPVPVLAIDDNPDALSLFQRYVSDTRYRLAGVSDLAHALGFLEEFRPQVIILDVMMPGVDGWQLLGRLTEHPKSRGIPVIVCTVLAQEQLALILGAAGFLRKPVSRSAFLAALDSQVGLMPR